ncbi:Cof-type HAD-IIB family hydrolase [Clostridium hydrogenum]|uniref:Cof-type HAD-IIB family hydrolase n=1 Tax=Clostridium hydrogenum TaxID=2855764 RepID=UPI001F1C7695|nr:Cof-type HAD-IIB family hydrolase [Clostridium hydrogenum]
MKYKLVCIDMDGTLLNSKKRVSDFNKSAIKKAHELGAQIVITTGRVYENAEFYSNLIGVKSPVIASNGAIIKEKCTNEIIYKRPIGIEILKDIVSICNKYRVKANFNTHNSFICGSKFTYVLINKLFLKSMKLSSNGKLNLEYFKDGHELMKKLEEKYDDIIKCEIIHISAKKISALKKELQGLEDIEVVSSSTNNIEITAKHVSKGKAVEALAKYYKIQREEIICIGDSENDLSMIEYAGLGVAMGNAREFIKDKADYVTDTNNNDGVGKVIDKFILKENVACGHN